MSMPEEDIYAALTREFAPAYRIPELTQSRDWANRFARARGRPQEGERLMKRLFPEERFDFYGIREEWEAFLRDDPKGDVHFYVHILFCRKVCSYCSYYTAPLRDDGALDDYLKRMDDGLKFFAPAFSGKSLQSFYIGGGTPSILNADQLERFLGGIFDRYAFDEKGQKTFEMNPASVTEEKLRVLKRRGINRISMGVQSFDAAALSAENREYQDRDMVVKAMRAIRKVGGFYLNIDLLLGMRGDALEGFLSTLDGVMENTPDTIVVYTVQPTPQYLKAFYEGETGRFGKDLNSRYPDAGPKSKEVAQRRGYRWKGTLLLEEIEWLFKFREAEYDFSAVYSDYSGDPASLFALGPTSRSRIAGRLSYREGVSRSARFDPAERILEGERLTPRGEMTRYLLMSLASDRTVSRKRFHDFFGTDVDEAFPEALRRLKEAKATVDEDEWIRFTAREPKALFEQALRFMEIEKADERLYGCEIVLSSGAASLTLCVEEADAAAEYFAVESGAGLRVLGELAALFSEKVYDRMLKLLKAVFQRAAKPGGGAAEVAARLRGELEAAAPQLGLEISGPRRGKS